MCAIENTVQRAILCGEKKKNNTFFSMIKAGITNFIFFLFPLFLPRRI